MIRWRKEEVMGIADVRKKSEIVDRKALKMFGRVDRLSW